MPAIDLDEPFDLERLPPLPPARRPRRHRPHPPPHHRDRRLRSPTPHLHPPRGRLTRTRTCVSRAEYSRRTRRRIAERDAERPPIVSRGRGPQFGRARKSRSPSNITASSARVTSVTSASPTMYASTGSPQADGTRSTMASTGSSGLPLPWRGRLLAACWAGGASASHRIRSAAELWETPRTLDRRRRDHVPSLAPSPPRRPHRARVASRLGAVDGTVVDCIPVTTPARTIFDLAGVVGPTYDRSRDRERVASSADHGARARRDASSGSAGGTCRDTPLSVRALVRRSGDEALTESEAETPRHATSRPARTSRRRSRSTRSAIDDGRFVARVDLAYPELKIAIEYDSYAHHVGRDALVRDSARRTRSWRSAGCRSPPPPNDLRNGGHRLAIDVRRARIPANRRQFGGIVPPN